MRRKLAQFSKAATERLGRWGRIIFIFGAFIIQFILQGASRSYLRTAFSAPPRDAAAVKSFPYIATAHENLPSDVGALRLLSYNVLLPNSEDGWWLYKNYLPGVPEEARTWEARKSLLHEEILAADADVVCVQEASGRSPYQEDFDFMFQHGYKGTLLKKGRMRCATFWRPEVVELVREPLSKDRTLITPFVLKGEGADDMVWVINAHLAAGPQPGRRLRQAHEALETVRKERQKMKVDDVAPAVIFCGDLNADDELEGNTAVDRLLTVGSVEKNFVDPHHPELGPVSSKNRKQACGLFVDAYAAAFPDSRAPSTLIAPELIDLFFTEDRQGLTSELDASINSLFDRYAIESSEAETPIMDQTAVDRWLLEVNRNSTRGSEYRAALAAFERNSEAILKRRDFQRVYREELEAGKFWGVAHDLWVTGTHQGCLPEPHEAAAALETFEARFDRIYFTESTLELRAVRQPSAEGAKKPLPNEKAPSDHLPIGVTLQLRR